MDIVICIKVVPDSTALIRIKGDGKDIDPTGVKFSISPYDEFALEEAIRLKEREGGSLTVVTAGPQRSEEGIRTALAMGADSAVFIRDPSLEHADPGYTADLLARQIKKMKYDLILTGKQAIDDDTGYVPQALAELLGIPCVTTVSRFEVDPASRTVRLSRQVEGGEEIYTSPLPMLIGFGKGDNLPRLPTLPNIMKAKRKPVSVVGLQELGVPAPPPSRVISLSAPPRRKGVKFAEGDTTEAKVEALLKMLQEEARLL